MPAGSPELTKKEKDDKDEKEVKATAGQQAIDDLNAKRAAEKKGTILNLDSKTVKQ